MLKMQIDPAMCMKTKGAHDRMTGVLQKFADIVCPMTCFFCFQGAKKTEHATRAHECVGNTVLGVRGWEATLGSAHVAAQYEYMKTDFRTFAP
jgi:hypothetical protein